MSDYKYRQMFVPIHALDFPGDDNGMRAAEVAGYGCADVDRLPPLPPLEERVDLAALGTWNAANQAARNDYHIRPTRACTSNRCDRLADEGPTCGFHQRETAQAADRMRARRTP